MGDGLKLLFALVFACVTIYCSYWIAKNVSYWFFYEDMVKQTIEELVKPEALK